MFILFQQVSIKIHLKTNINKFEFILTLLDYYIT